MKILLKNFLKTLGILLIISLTACNSNDNGDDGDNNTEPTAPTSNNGAWEGTLEFTGEAPFNVIAVLIDGKITIFPGDGDVRLEDQGAWSGSYPINGDNIDGTATKYDFDGDEVLGEAQDDLEMLFTGSVTDRRFLFLDFEVKTIPGGVVENSGTIDLEFTDDGNNSSISSIEGSWTFDTLTINVAADGSFWGQDANGCVYSGDISILDSEYNLYGVESEASIGCGDAAGIYSGFAAVNYDDTPNNLTTFGVNPDNFLILEFDRD